MRSFYTRLLPTLEQLPGVAAVAASTDLPLGIRERRAFAIEAESDATTAFPHTVAHDWVVGRYFEALGIGLKRGRYLSPSDTQSAERVVVINETMARMFWRDAGSSRPTDRLGQCTDPYAVDAHRRRRRRHQTGAAQFRDRRRRRFSRGFR